MNRKDISELFKKMIQKGTFCFGIPLKEYLKHQSFIDYLCTLNNIKWGANSLFNGVHFEPTMIFKKGE